MCIAHVLWTISRNIIVYESFGRTDDFLLHVANCSHDWSCHLLHKCVPYPFFYCMEDNFIVVTFLLAEWKKIRKHLCKILFIPKCCETKYISISIIPFVVCLTDHRHFLWQKNAHSCQRAVLTISKNVFLLCEIDLIFGLKNDLQHSYVGINFWETQCYSFHKILVKLIINIKIIAYWLDRNINNAKSKWEEPGAGVTYWQT